METVRQQNTERGSETETEKQEDRKTQRYRETQRDGDRETDRGKDDRYREEEQKGGPGYTISRPGPNDALPSGKPSSSEGSMTFPNIATIWGPNAETHEPVGDI